MGSIELVAAPDEELLCALEADRSSALGALYDRYGRLVFGLARAVLGSAVDAEDLTQEIFLGLLNRWQYDPARGSLSAFLVTVTRSRALDKLRARGRKLRLLERFKTEGETEAAVDPLADAAQSDLAKNVREALARLPESQRQVLELAYYKGLSQTEIADRLETPLGTVKSWARRGLFTLRDALKDFTA